MISTYVHRREVLCLVFGVSVIDIYQHFRKEEHELIDQLIDKCNRANDQYSPILTPFLDPRGQYIMNVEVTFYGGPFAERKRAMIAPSYFQPDAEAFEIVLIEIDYPQKFVTLQHQHILGTIMSLGIERDQLGDIVVDDRIQFTLTKQLESYIILELTKIKGASVKLNSIPTEDMIQSEENWKVHSTTVSALRLDVVLKEIIHNAR